jgi:hypothetical protein
MENHTINVAGAQEFGRARSRRDFFKSLAVAGAGATAASMLLSGKASAQTTDLDILNFALTIEYFESEVFYPAALNAGILSADAKTVVAQLVDIEVQHRDALIDLIKSLGGTPVNRPKFAIPDYVLASEGAFLETALAQELTDVGAFLGAAPMIQSPDVLAAAGSIAGVEGENVVAVRRLLGLVPYANEAFPAAVTMEEALAELSPFVVGGTMPSTGGPKLSPEEAYRLAHL